MSRYTITLQEMTDLEIPIFDETMENAVSPFIQSGSGAVFTSAKWNQMKDRFYKHYKYRELGFETIELWRDYWIDTFESIIDKYIKEWSVVVDDYLSNNSSKFNRVVYNTDLPFTKLTSSEDYASFKTEENAKSSNIEGRTQMEMLKKFANDFHDIDDAFLNEFNDLFMGVYDYE